MLYAPGTFTGNYIPTPQDPDATPPDVISIHEFSPGEEDTGEVNLRLAQFVLKMYPDESSMPPIVGTKSVNQALHQMSGATVEVTYPVTGDSSGVLGDGVGTWGEVLTARRAMEENNHTKLLIVGFRYHVGRAALQAQKAGISDFVVPPDLPGGFPAKPGQIWTRPGLWQLRELVGTPVLRHRGQI